MLLSLGEGKAFDGKALAIHQGSQSHVVPALGTSLTSCLPYYSSVTTISTSCFSICGCVSLLHVLPFSFYPTWKISFSLDHPRPSLSLPAWHRDLMWWGSTHSGRLTLQEAAGHRGQEHAPRRWVTSQLCHWARSITLSELPNVSGPQFPLCETGKTMPPNS